MQARSTRRDFVKRSALAAGATMACSVAAPYVLSAPEPSKKLGVAVFAGGGMGQDRTGQGLDEGFGGLVGVGDVGVGHGVKRGGTGGQKRKK